MNFFIKCHFENICLVSSSFWVFFAPCVMNPQTKLLDNSSQFNNDADNKNRYKKERKETYSALLFMGIYI